MKSVIKSMIPEKLMPIALKVYSELTSRTSKVDFSNELYDELTALKCLVAYNKYGGYCIPRSSVHRPAAKKIIANDVYEPETIEYMISSCDNGDIVHAGTFFGDFLPALANGIANNAKIWAFEPNPESYRCAKITIEINDIKNIELKNAGLGAKEEEMLLQTADENGNPLGGGSQIIPKEVENVDNVEKIYIETVDSVVGSDRNVSIIQLDVEGFEKDALIGALNTIKRCLPIIILEVLPGSTLLDSEWFSKNILSLGYHEIKNIHGNSVFICGY